MKSRVSRGFTLMELIIVVAIIGVLVSIVGFGITKCSSSQGTAEDEARAYASKAEGIDPDLLQRFYEGYLNLLHNRALQSRSEGAFERANLFEEIAHQWECMHIITNFNEYPGLLSLYVDELARMYPKEP